MTMEEKFRSRETIFNEFMSAKACVKDLVDSGVAKLPEVFKLPTETKHSELLAGNDIQEEVPLVNLEGYEGEKRKDVVADILQASRKWGIFQIVNHGVPLSVMNDMLESLQQFHEQPMELKEEFYSHIYDYARKVWYYITLDPKAGCAYWKDSIAWKFDNISEDSEALPLICRTSMLEYVRHLVQLKYGLSKLLSEALGLRSDHLERMECMEARKLVGHYYPACPEPELTLGTPRHTDPYFITILQQNDIGGFQALHQNRWIDVPPVEGALIVIIGDMLRLVSNDVFTSAEHRVLASRNGPRLSTACFFSSNIKNKDQIYGPIKELVSDDDPAVYKETTHAGYLKCFNAHENRGSLTLPCFRK